MKKTILLTSLLALFIVLFTFSVSAYSFEELPQETITYDIVNIEPSEISSLLGLDPTIFYLTSFQDSLTYNSPPNILYIGLLDSSSARESLQRSLSNWFELSPNVNFSDFNDIKIGYSNDELTHVLDSFYPYHNRDELIYYFNTIGNYYKLERLSGNEITVLNSTINSLENQIQALENQIQSLESTINQNNATIARLEIDVSKAYTKGLEESEIVQNSFISIATMPFYFLKSIFNFEVFGVNFLTIIQVLLTLLFVSVVIKIFI